MSVEGTSVPVLAPRSASTPPRREPSAKGAPGPVQLSPDSSSPQELKFIYFLAWLLCAIFYFYQYAVRSAPGVMLDDLTAAWGANKIGALISAYYTVYALMALVAGVLLDRYGARRTVPLGIAIVAVGCIVFAQGAEVAGVTGFVIQAIGAVFAFIGGSYVAARYLPERMLAIFLGFTQCLGMAGAAFGSKPVQMAIDPEGSFHLPWQTVWIAFAVMGFALAAATWIVMPKEKDDSVSHHGPISVASLAAPFKVVFSNLQSWLAGIIGGLLFVPTTIGALVWATAFLHNGEHLSMADAASDASMVAIGWIVGCPLLGYLRQDWPSQAGADRRRARHAGCQPRRRLCARGRRLPALPGRPRARHRVGRGHDPVFDDQGSQPVRSERDGRRRDELSRLPDDRRDVTVHLPPDAAI